jgi:hypothetical protein
MFEQFRRFDPAIGRCQAAGQQILALGGDRHISKRDAELFAADVADDFLLSFAFKGGLAGQHDVKDNSQGPRIAALIIPALEDLRGHVVGGAGLRLHIVFGL